MKTGRYRVRPGAFGTAVLQREYDSPALIGGHVDASVREIHWTDVKFNDLDAILFKPANEPSTEGK